MLKAAQACLLLLLALGPCHLAVADEPLPPDVAESLGIDPDAPPVALPELPGLPELMGIAVSAQFRAPGLRAQADAYSNAELVAALGALRRQEKGVAEPAAKPDMATLQQQLGLQQPPSRLLQLLLADADALAQVGWLPPAEFARVKDSIEAWEQQLDVEGRGADAKLVVEPLYSLYTKRVSAAPLARYVVVSRSSPLSGFVLLDIDQQGERCCRVLEFESFGDDPPTAFASLRDYLEYLWMAGELVRPHLEKPAAAR